MVKNPNGSKVIFRSCRTSQSDIAGSKVKSKHKFETLIALHFIKAQMIIYIPQVTSQNDQCRIIFMYSL